MTDTDKIELLKLAYAMADHHLDNNRLGTIALGVPHSDKGDILKIVLSIYFEL